MTESDPGVASEKASCNNPWLTGIRRCLQLWRENQRHDLSRRSETKADWRFSLM
jgi:hypothetical protein